VCSVCFLTSFYTVNIIQCFDAVGTWFVVWPVTRFSLGETKNECVRALSLYVICTSVVFSDPMAAPQDFSFAFLALSRFFFQSYGNFALSAPTCKC